MKLMIRAKMAEFDERSSLCIIMLDNKGTDRYDFAGHARPVLVVERRVADITVHRLCGNSI